MWAALWLAGVAATLLWSAHPQVAGWRLVLAWALVVLAGALALGSWWRSPRGVLAWDGAAWTWTREGAAAVTGELQVGLDLQQALLVRWRAPGERGWFWLERAGGERWDELRRAVYSRARPAALPHAGPPAAKP